MGIDKYDFAVKILKYWYLIEFLGQTNFPMESKENWDNNKKAEDGKTNWFKQITVYHPFFPEEKSPIMAFEDDSQTYPSHAKMSDEVCICMGKVPRGDCDEYLKQKFNMGDDSVEVDYSKICLIGLKCDSQGIYIKKSLSISPLIWGITRLQHSTDKVSSRDLAEFLSLNDYNIDMSLMEEQLMRNDGDGNRSGQALSSGLLQQLFQSVANTYILPLFGSVSSVTSEGVMIYRRYQSEEDKSKDSDSLYFSDLSNSFFTNDLQMILNSNFLRRPLCDKDATQEAFIDYIVGAYAEEHAESKWIDFSKRVDIQKGWNGSNQTSREDFFNRYFDVALAPTGKWPSKYMPAFMQQLAVNFGMHQEETGRSIFSVNGPPGTGKTTLLKEIIAGNLVERAKLLVQHGDPDAAFVEKRFQDGDKSKNGYSKYHNVYYELKNSEIKKYGMLVASCNNAAVENITKELPDGVALCKGLMTNEKDDLAVGSGLAEVRKLFDIQEDTHTEEYKVWNDEQNQFCFKPYSDIYFTKYANDMIASKSKTEQSRWGIISAPFGKASNITHYARKVLLPYIQDFGTNDKIDERKGQYTEAARQFKNQLATVEEMQRRIGIVSHARGDFLKKKFELEQQCSHLLETIDKNRQHIKQLQAKAMELERQQQELAALEQEEAQAVDSLKMQRERQTFLVHELDSNIQDIKREIMELEDKRGVKDWFFGLIGKVSMLTKTIDEKYAKLSQIEEIYNEHSGWSQQIFTQMQAQEKRFEEISLQAQQIDKKHKEAIYQTETSAVRIEQMQKSITDVKNEIERAWVDYQGILQAAKKVEDVLHQTTVLDESFWQMYDSKSEVKNTEAQVLNPWFTVEYNREREKLFYLALQVHKNFFWHLSPVFSISKISF